MNMYRIKYEVIVKKEEFIKAKNAKQAKEILLQKCARQYPKATHCKIQHSILISEDKK